MTALPTPRPSLPGKGPLPCSVMLVTEAATADDLWKGYPLAGNPGDLFSKMLHEAGLIRAACRIVAAHPTRPKDDNLDPLYTQTKSEAQKLGLGTDFHGTWVHASVPGLAEVLQKEVLVANPKVIVAIGDFAMFLLTGVFGAVATWRGSMLETTFQGPDGKPFTVIPTYPAATVMKKWEVRGFVIRDLQRVRDYSLSPELYQYPTYTFITRPTFQQVQQTLASLLLQVNAGKELVLACDLETIARHVSCVGIAWSVREALCIPYMTLDGHYWSEEEEVQIQFMLKALLTHPLTEVIGQNFNYDNQHFAKHFGYLPRLTFDTMIAQHVLFPGIPKGLGFLSSMYCHWHRYWKDEMDDYSRLPENMAQYWTYNCKDCVVTFEVALVLRELLSHLRRLPQYEFMHRTSVSALRSMLLGMRIDIATRADVAGQLLQAIAEHETLIQDIVGFPLNVGSSKQMSAFFYGELKLPVQINRKTKRPSLDASALATLCLKEPLIRPLVELIEKKRSLGVFLSTFCLMPLDSDSRMRCSFNVCGTETMRFSSSSNAFGNGGNLQNIPKGDKE